MQVMPVLVVVSDDEAAHGLLVFGINTDKPSKDKDLLVVPGDLDLGHQLSREEAWPLMMGLLGLPPTTPMPEVAP